MEEKERGERGERGEGKAASTHALQESLRTIDFGRHPVFESMKLLLSHFLSKVIIFAFITVVCFSDASIFHFIRPKR